MSTESIPAKFMRPRPYSESRGFNWRTCYKYIDDGLFPAYKFRGLVLLDVAECDSILMGLVRREPLPVKQPREMGRPKTPGVKRTRGMKVSEIVAD